MSPKRLLRPGPPTLPDMALLFREIIAIFLRPIQTQEYIAWKIQIFTLHHVVHIVIAGI